MPNLLLVAALLVPGLGVAAEERRAPRPQERTRESPESREDEPARSRKLPTMRRQEPSRGIEPALPSGPPGSTPKGTFAITTPRIEVIGFSPPAPTGTFEVTTPAIEVVGFSPPAPTGTFEVTTPAIEVIGFSPPAPTGTFSIQTAPIDVIGFPQKTGSILLEAPGAPAAPSMAPAPEENLP